MTYTIEPLAPELTFGRRIRGLTDADIGQESEREKLRQVWSKHGLLLFQDGDSSDEFQLALSRVFGPLARHPVRETQKEGNPDLIVIRSEPGDTIVVDIDGDVGGAWLGWHSDMVYYDTINHGGLLKPVQLPSRGGLTGFIDQIDAYARLPEDTRRRIEGLDVVYRLGQVDESPLAYKGTVRLVEVSNESRSIQGRVETDFPPVVHPLVYEQKETGRKVLNLSPMFAKSIAQMPNSEGDTLLAELAGHLLDCPQYHHTWALGDMMLWDNWRMVHSISPAPADETRIMQRTTIAGDYALGRKLEIETA